MCSVPPPREPCERRGGAREALAPLGVGATRGGVPERIGRWAHLGSLSTPPSPVIDCLCCLGHGGVHASPVGSADVPRREKEGDQSRGVLQDTGRPVPRATGGRTGWVLPAREGSARAHGVAGGRGRRTGSRRAAPRTSATCSEEGRCQAGLVGHTGGRCVRAPGGAPRKWRAPRRGGRTLHVHGYPITPSSCDVSRYLSVCCCRKSARSAPSRQRPPCAPRAGARGCGPQSDEKIHAGSVGRSASGN